ncbi:LysR family transcriptional regulator [Reyranella sp.]|uniref:LysR family transcriptional regulator n=1 Tax=Reyranella sp. TaxID=1929291 RepID=UPI003BACB6CF
MNLRSIDLNLLVIFDALMAEKGITRAAKAIGMTPSAVSHALGRLRQTFGDPLFGRTPTGMQPTRRALELIPFVRAALHSLQHGIALQHDFDPATSQRIFNLRQSDFMSDCLLPRLCARLRAEAPGVTLVVGQLPDDDENPYAPGDIQMRVGARVRGPEYRRKRIWRDPFAVAMRAGHPARRGTLTFDRFLELPFLDVSSAIVDRRSLDEVLRSRGATRRTAVTIPTLAGVVAVLAHTDLCAVLPQRWVALYSAPSELATMPLPEPLHGIEYAVDMIWHASDERNAGHRWLRRLIVEEFDVLYAPPVLQKRRVGHPPSRLDEVPPLAAAS